MFSVDQAKITAWVAQLIAYDCLPASIDFVNRLIKIKLRSQKDDIETLIANYGEKLNILLESNEKHWEAKSAALKVGNSGFSRQKVRKQ